MSNQRKKKRPFCAEEVRFEAIKCKHCGEALPEPTVQSGVKPKTVSLRKAWPYLLLAFFLPLTVLIFSNRPAPPPDTRPQVQGFTMFGLGEDKLKEIYKEVVKVEDNAYRELGYEPYSVEAPYDEVKLIQERERATIAEKYDLTTEQLGEVVDEGLRRTWPLE